MKSSLISLMLVGFLCVGCGGQRNIDNRYLSERLCSVGRPLSPPKLTIENTKKTVRLVVTTSDVSFQSGQLVWSIFDAWKGGNKADWTKYDLSGDAVVRAPLGSEKIYAINRRGAERAGSIEVFSKASGMRVGNYSVGKNTNPQDIWIAQDHVAYVARMNAKNLLKLKASDGSEACGIDLSSLADADGIPEMNRILLVNENELWVTLQRLDSRQANMPPTEKSSIAVIDPHSDLLLEKKTITLAGLNPVSDLKRGPHGLIYVADYGRGSANGGVEGIDPATHESKGFIVKASDIGGDILDFEFVNDSKIVAVVSGKDEKMKIISFNLALKKIESILMESTPAGFSFSGIWKSDDGTIWITNRDTLDPRLDRFDSNLAPLPSIRVGLAPYFMALTD